MSPRCGQVGPSWGQVGPSWAKLGPSWGQVGPKLSQVGAKLGLSWAKLGLKWTNIAIKMRLEGKSGKYTKTKIIPRENHSFGGVLGVKLAPSWDMLGSIEAMLSQAGPTWT